MKKNVKLISYTFEDEDGKQHSVNMTGFIVQDATMFQPGRHVYEVGKSEPTTYVPSNTQFFNLVATRQFGPTDGEIEEAKKRDAGWIDEEYYKKYKDDYPHIKSKKTKSIDGKP